MKRYLITFKKGLSRKEICECLDKCKHSNHEPKDLALTLTQNKHKETPHTTIDDIHILELSESEVNELRHDLNVESIEPDINIKWINTNPSWPPHIPDTDDYQDNIYSIQGTDAWRVHGVSGKNISIAIIDTGIRHNHPFLGRVTGVSFVDGESSWYDYNGHGTHVAGIVKQIAYNCNLIAVRVLDMNGSGFLSNILAGIDWCIKNNIRVANMSLGASAHPGTPSCWNAYKKISDRILKSNTFVCAASGNNGPGGITGNPAICDGFMAVGSLDHRKGDIVSDFTARGPNVNESAPNFGLEILAPGRDIYSTFNYPDWATMSGTSMACPHVAGVAGQVAERGPHLSGHEIRKILRNSAWDVQSTGRDFQSGYGYLSALRAINSMEAL